MYKRLLFASISLLQRYGSVGHNIEQTSRLAVADEEALQTSKYDMIKVWMPFSKMVKGRLCKFFI